MRGIKKIPRRIPNEASNKSNQDQRIAKRYIRGYSKFKRSFSDLNKNSSSNTFKQRLALERFRIRNILLSRLRLARLNTVKRPIRPFAIPPWKEGDYAAILLEKEVSPIGGVSHDGDITANKIGFEALAHAKLQDVNHVLNIERETNMFAYGFDIYPPQPRLTPEQIRKIKRQQRGV